MTGRRQARLTSMTMMSTRDVSAQDSSRLSLLAVHAHPDDEASKGAPTVAKYVAQGVHTVLVCCTGGEEGDLQNPSLREPGQPFHGLSPDEERQVMADLRPQELKLATDIIGYHSVHMLGYRDSGMAGSESNNNPECFHMADLDDATERLVRIIRSEKPHVILTYNDDQSGYPHPDHLRVHDVSVLAFQRAGDPFWYADAGEPWQPLKMYYTLWSKKRIVTIHEAMIKKTGTSPYNDEWLDRPSQDHRITTRIDVAQYLWARSGALRAHATQVDPNEPWWFGLDDDELAQVYPWEEWVLAVSAVGGVEDGTYEDDLFRGVV